jgi:hypothetical protein
MKNTWQDGSLNAAGMVRASIERERSVVPKAETSIKPLVLLGGMVVVALLAAVALVVGL